MEIWRKSTDNKRDEFMLFNFFCLHHAFSPPLISSSFYVPSTTYADFSSLPTISFYTLYSWAIWTSKISASIKSYEPLGYKCYSSKRKSKFEWNESLGQPKPQGYESFMHSARVWKAMNGIAAFIIIDRCPPLWFAPKGGFGDKRDSPSLLPQTKLQ